MLKDVALHAIGGTMGNLRGNRQPLRRATARESKGSSGRSHALMQVLVTRS